MSDIRLRPWSDGDLPLLVRANEPGMTEHLGGPETEEGVLGRHARYVRFAAEGIAHIYVAELDGVAAGSIGWWDSDFDDEDVHETGWFTLPEFQGRGVAKEALRQVVADAREHGSLPRLMALPAVANAPSNAVCASAGFVNRGPWESEFRGSPFIANVWMLELR